MLSEGSIDHHCPNVPDTSTLVSLSSCLVVGGLSLDIVGAFGIAVPDFPRLRTFFRLGRLNKGLDIAENGTLKRGEIGFNDVLSLLKTVDCPDGHEFIEEGYTANRIQYEEHSGPVYGGTPVSRHIYVYFDEPYEGDSDRERRQRHRIGDVRRAVHKQIDQQELRIRALGFMALIFGFGLQIVAQFV